MPCQSLTIDYAPAWPRCCACRTSRGEPFSVTGTYQVTIGRNEEHQYGIEISGGLEFNELPIIIIHDHSAVSYQCDTETLSSPSLKTNDVIIDINGKSAIAMTHEELTQEFKESDEVALAIAAIPDECKPDNDEDAVYTYTELIEASKQDNATEWLKKMTQIARTRIFLVSVPWTTRPMRKGEVDGREYEFKTEADFTSRIKLNKEDHVSGFFEFNQNPNGYWYGSPTVTADFVHSGDYKKRADKMKVVKENEGKEATVDTVLDPEVLKRLSRKQRRCVCCHTVLAFCWQRASVASREAMLAW